MQLLPVNHDQFPKSLSHFLNEPRPLYWRGDLRLLSFPRISIVGARENSPWVEDWMEHELLPTLKKYKISVVSGGARGIDQMSHWAAIRAGVPTLFVLPSGLDSLYPKSLVNFQEYKNALFLTEYSPQEKMLPHHFHRRNQLIAALGKFLLVVQSSEKSGTMISAQAAIEMGKTVYALPGNVLDQKMSGNNKLLFDGATMIRNRWDLEAALETEL